MAAWRTATHRRPSIEWAMIDQVNDTEEQARLLAPIAQRLGAYVNLIPLNPTPGYPVVGSSPNGKHGPDNQWGARQLKALGSLSPARVASSAPQPLLSAEGPPEILSGADDEVVEFWRTVVLTVSSR